MISNRLIFTNSETVPKESDMNISKVFKASFKSLSLHLQLNTLKSCAWGFL